MIFRYFLLLCLAFGMAQANAQQRSTGAIFNASTIEATPQKVTLSFRSFAAMPSSYSLEKYCPTPANQGNQGQGTCVAFANGIKHN